MDEREKTDPKNSLKQQKRLAFIATIVLMLMFIMVVVITRRLTVDDLPETGVESVVYEVNSFFDDVDIDPDDGICDTDPAPGVVACTLRAAMQQSNSDGKPSRIEFSSILEDEEGVIEIVLNSPLPEIIKNGESADDYDLVIEGNTDDPEPDSRKVIIRINNE